MVDLPTYIQRPLVGDTRDELRPKRGRGKKQPRGRQITLRAFLRVAKIIRHSQMRAAKGRTIAWPRVAGWRRVVCRVKSGPQKTQAPSWRAYGQYLTRNKACRERSGFDREREEIDVATRMNEWQHAQDQQYWKIMLSPERTEGIDLDLKSYAREFMRQLESERRTSFEWMGAVHTNTAQPHVHLVLRERDSSGNRFEFSHDYVRDRMLPMACSVATEQAGYEDRTQKRDQQRDRQRERNR